MTDRPASMDGTLINAVEPIPKEHRRAFLAELRAANRFHLARSFAAHWKLRDFIDWTRNKDETE